MRFELRGPGDVLVDSWDDKSPCGGEPIVVLEGQKYFLHVVDAPGDGDFLIRVGEERLSLECRWFGKTCELQGGDYFESASGRSVAAVFAVVEDGSEQMLCERAFYVLPSKIGKENYSRMVADLQAVCRSLVNDLIGKSQHSYAWNRALQARMFRSCEEELLSVTRVWKVILPLLCEIERSPFCEIAPQFRLGECLRNRSFRNIPIMMKRGIDPCNPEPGRKCRLVRIGLSPNVAEHQVIKGFLIFLEDRLAACKSAIHSEINTLEGDRRYRSRSLCSGDVSLYESEDVPRICKLRQYEKRVTEIRSDIRLRLSQDFWRGISAKRTLPISGQFAENRYYIKIANAILDYLRDGFNHSARIGESLTTKKTSRMFEQWMIVQLVAAFEQCGLQIDSWDDIVERSISSQFGFDFKRNTRFSAKLSDGYSVCLRYEPWILPKALLSSHPEETLCHGGKEDAYWSPDCVIELRRGQGADMRVVYAVVLDAKYTRNPSKDMSRNVSKYSLIRSNEGNRGRQVARQVWIVYTGREDESPGIRVDDDSVEFLPDSGLVYRDSSEPFFYDESVRGEIVVRPEAIASDCMDDVLTRGIALCRPFYEFVRGTLAYFRGYINEN